MFLVVTMLRTRSTSPVLLRDACILVALWAFPLVRRPPVQVVDMEQVPDYDAPIIHSDAQRIRASSVDA